jgi:hypothetical protein
MARHRTSLTPLQRRAVVLRWAGRGALWLLLGVVVGAAALAALTWAGSLPGIRVWVSLGAGLLAAAAAGVGSTVPGPGASDERPGGPSES